MAVAERVAPDGRQIIWEPNSKPQRALLSCPVFEVFFGGARGGGKTDGVLGDWAQHASTYGKNAIGLMVRRTSLQLGETFERAKVIFTPLGARFIGSPQGGGMAVTMPGGARLTFAHLERDTDAENYQGNSYTRVYVEEAGNFPSPAPIMKLMATLRSGAGVPCRMRLTGNPGGPGHGWVKARYIEPAPLGMKVLVDPDSGLDRVFIPSKVTDNKAVGADYIRRLKMAGSPELVRAWLQGDWDVVAGAYFPEWDVMRHVIAPISLPSYWTRFRAFDWGSAHPFCCLWFAVSDGTVPSIAKDALVIYREWYGSDGRPNVGLRLPADAIARGIKDRDGTDQIMYSVADPAIFASDGGPSIAERMGNEGIYWTRADNKRVAGRGAMGGWDQIRTRLIGQDDKPMLVVFASCTNLIRTLPAMQHDPNRPEDIQTDSDDHAVDTARYGCSSRPWVAVAPTAPSKRDSWAMAFDREDAAEDSWRVA